MGLKEWVTPMLIVPVSIFRKSRIRSAQASASWMVRRANGSISSPASVSRMEWLSRMNSCVPSSSSSCLICCESELWAIFRQFAACEKFSVSAAFAKYLNCLSSIWLQNYKKTANALR